MMNMAQLLNLLRNGNNPEQLVMGLFEQQLGQTEMGQNILTLAKAGQSGELEKIARNLCQSKGKDFDSEFSAFTRELGF